MNTVNEKTTEKPIVPKDKMLKQITKLKREYKERVSHLEDQIEALRVASINMKETTGNF